MELPIYKIVFDPEMFESGINMIALTETPAIEITAMRFTDEKPMFFFNEEQQIVAGPAIIPNKKIYRKDEKGNEFYVIFEPETIIKMVEKFNSEIREVVFNKEHSDTKITGFINGKWIIEDPEHDKSKFYGFELPKHTFFIEAKIDSKEDWEYIKSLPAIGFSIEGFMDVAKLTEKTKFKKQKMKKTRKFIAQRSNTRKIFNKVSKKYFEETVISEDQEILLVPELKEGEAVEVISDSNEIVTAEDGTYVIPTEEVEITIVDGKIEEIQSVVEEMEEEKPIEEEKPVEEEKPKEEEMEMDPELVAKLADLETRLAILESKMPVEEQPIEQFSKKRSNVVETLIQLQKI